MRELGSVPRLEVPEQAEPMLVEFPAAGTTERNDAVGLVAPAQ